MTSSRRKSARSRWRWLEFIVRPLRPGSRQGSFGLLGRTGRGEVPVISGRGARPWEFPGVTPATANTASQWLIDALDHRWAKRPRVPATVASFVPTRFAAYARIFHPVPRMRTIGEDGTSPMPSLRWADVAEWSGQTLRADTEFRQLATLRPDLRSRLADLAIATPASELPPELLSALAIILQTYTTRPETCWFALWDGYGDLGLDARSEREPARLNLPARSYLLYVGPVAAATAFATPGAPHAPTLWWPEDRAWFVGGDVDLDSTYVGGSEALIEELLRHPAIEALPMLPTQSISDGSG